MRRVFGIGLLTVLILSLACLVPSEAHAARVFFGIGVPLGVAPGPWWWAPPYYYPYAPPPVVVQSPPVYEQAPPPEPAYWYYCSNPQGYYPYVSQCPSGWMRVVPPSAPPSR